MAGRSVAQEISDKVRKFCLQLFLRDGVISKGAELLA